MCEQCDMISIAGEVSSSQELKGTHFFQVSWLLSLLSFTKCQDPEDAKSRFDKILADFGFSDFNTINIDSSQNAPVQQPPPLRQFPGGNQNFVSAQEIAPRDRGQSKPKANNSGGSPLDNLIDIASGRNRKV